MKPANATQALDHVTDYQRIERAIRFLRQSSSEQPSLHEVAKAVHLSEFHLQRLFSRWAGISPKRFLQLLTIQHAKEHLARSEDVLTASLQSGLSGSGRLHDLFVSIEAVTPGEFKSRGKGVQIECGFHNTPFGQCLIGLTERGICYLEFVTNRPRAGMIEHLKSRWPEATVIPSEGVTQKTIRHMFSPQSNPQGSLNLLVKGTNFQLQVWSALLQIPRGYVASYSDIANWIGKPSASRAVGNAVGSNPIAWLIPCHRVLRSDGTLGGYNWGVDRKRACLIWEDHTTANDQA